MKKSTIESLGYFGEQSYVTIGDTYGQKPKPESREKGPQMLSHVGKLGKTADVTFQKFTSLWPGEKYQTLDETERKDELEKRKNNVGTGNFVPANPPKKGVGLGSYYGTIGGKYSHLADTEVRKLRPEDVKHELPNILTTAPKRGTFGVPGTTLGTYGTKVKTSGIVGEYTYASEPYDGAKEIEKVCNACLVNPFWSYPRITYLWLSHFSLFLYCCCYTLCFSFRFFLSFCFFPLLFRLVVRSAIVYIKYLL